MCTLLGKGQLSYYCIFIVTVALTFGSSAGQNYEVADIDCAIGNNGRELLSARLRRPDGFRGTPIFADDATQPSSAAAAAGSLMSSFNLLPSELAPGTNNIGLGPDSDSDVVKDPPCQIFPDPTDGSGRVYILRVSDFNQCGVLKRNGFIHVRVWFPQLAGVVMLSDQEVIIMCKPPSLTITQSKTAGFAGSIPNGARVSGVVEESPGRLEYEVALFRETSSGRSVPGAEGKHLDQSFITGMSQELQVDQAVPIGTRLQLRAKISPDSAWQHAKLMEVSVSPDPKNPQADGSVVLVRDGCRNPELASIIPKQPHRVKDRTNEVVLDFEAFLLSNMGERNTLWLHTQIKACMEGVDCTPEFCLDVYQPSGFGRRRRSLSTGTNVRRNLTSTSSGVAAAAAAGVGLPDTFEYVNPISQHWKTILDNHLRNSNASAARIDAPNPEKSRARTPADTDAGENAPKSSSSSSTNFDENIGFSVMMPADYYRSIKLPGSQTFECRRWILTSIGSAFTIVVLAVLATVLGFKLKRAGGDKGRDPFYAGEQRQCQRSSAGSGSGSGSSGVSVSKPCISTPIMMTDPGSANANKEKSSKGHSSDDHSTSPLSSSSLVKSGSHPSMHHHHHHRRSNINIQATYAKRISDSKYARDTSIYRP